MQTSHTKITVNSRKFDLAISRTWQCELVSQNSALIILEGEFDRDVKHPGLGSIRCGTISFEYFWLDRWYNIFRFHEPGGLLRNYYCNVAMPPTLKNGVLDYVDLDIDVIVWPDNSYAVLDRDDFEVNAKRYGYPHYVKHRAERSVQELLALVAASELPTD